MTIQSLFLLEHQQREKRKEEISSTTLCMCWSYTVLLSLARMPEFYLPSANNVRAGTEPVCMCDRGVRGNKLSWFCLYWIKASMLESNLYLSSVYFANRIEVSPLVHKRDGTRGRERVWKSRGRDGFSCVTGRKVLAHEPWGPALLLSLCMCDLVQTPFPLWSIVSLSVKFWTGNRNRILAAQLVEFYLRTFF